MRKIFGFAFLMAVLAAFATTSEASYFQGKGQGRQGGGFGGGMFGGGGGIGLINNESVQAELKVTDEQKEKLKAAMDELMPKLQEQRKEMFGKMAELKELPQEERAKKMAEMMKELNDPVEKKINEVLKTEQQSRLKQIGLQEQVRMMGPTVFVSEDVSKQLTINDEQKTKITSLAEEFGKDRREMMGGSGGGGGNKGGNRGNGGKGGGGFGKGGGGFGGFGMDPETRKKLDALVKEYVEKVNAILTPEQKAAWKKMTGEPFEVKYPAPRRKDD
ncbi:hypothetical protein KIH39_02295 [Telmatocola sphagniphila]|uniref:Uncharacterized protein n=1 Tax=Telmatocola sphagniphila TaxID=1123043 RepID=A0A8E6EYW3_9BACT|nr:hypothetical protein [Telmatocola sphagniphila]QVL32771.1 hypothetical protein KIH39_02295 [Telmatocola sphagniphila]